MWCDFEVLNKKILYYITAKSVKTTNEGTGFVQYFCFFFSNSPGMDTCRQSLHLILIKFVRQLSIQWGGIGDVGMAYQLFRDSEDKEINGIVAQKISSCLAALDTLLTQSATVVASHVIPSKKKQTTDSKSQSLTDVVAEIMGKVVLFYFLNYYSSIDTFGSKYTINPAFKCS